MSGDSGYSKAAAEYAARVDSSPHNAFYERPAMLSLLPPLEGLDVLDVGCGSGWYSERFIAGGARVTAFDFIPYFVEATTARVGDRAKVYLHDLQNPLTFAENASFDLVVAPLVLHYLRDWTAPLREISRILRPDGTLLFSTHHPFMDWREFSTPDYFATELLEDEWDIGTVRFYRRPISAMSLALAEAGFVIEQLLEPRPTPEFRSARPEWYERLLREPWFLVVKARTAGNAGELK